MPSEAQHLDQAAENEAVAALLETQYGDWAVTALFYSALHYVDMYFSAKQSSQNFRSHAERTDAVMTELTPIWRAYVDLRDESQLARYECRDYSSSDIQEVREHLFDPIKKFLRNKGVQIP